MPRLLNECHPMAVAEESLLYVFPDLCGEPLACLSYPLLHLDKGRNYDLYFLELNLQLVHLPHE